MLPLSTASTNTSIFFPVYPAHLSLGQRPGKKIYRLSEGRKTMLILPMRPPGSNFNGREYLQAAKFDRRRIFIIVAFARRARIFRSRVSHEVICSAMSAIGL